MTDVHLNPRIEARLLALGKVDAIVRAYEGMAHAVSRDLYAPGLESDDIIQEARLGVAKAARDYDAASGTTFPGFAWMCARRAAITAVVTAKRHKHEPLSCAADVHARDDEPDAALAAALTAGSDPADIVIQRERAWRLLAVVATDLTEMERLALTALEPGQGHRASHEVKYSDVAVRLGINYKAVDNARQRARKKLAAAA